jgi:flavin-dependent dehydrogenase
MSEYDVIVCGGGLAGLSLAHQLITKWPGTRIRVIERVVGPLPESACKVGESTIEQGAFYYSQVLGLKSHLEQDHLEKLGLRYFIGSGTPLAERPEFGVKTWLPVKSYQIDRGRLENYWRALLPDLGVELDEGTKVQDVELTAHRATHAVTCVDERGKLFRIHGRWIVDATGRRRFLQRKLKLSKPDPMPHNSAWFRVRGVVGVDDLVPRNQVDWHDRVRVSRWYSTNHLMGKGYWVWVIPLAPGNTSIGIVASDADHPFVEYNTFDKAMRWLAAHEPELAQAIRREDLMDFRTLHDYSYSSYQVFSSERWCCVGEAGVFADPYYSVGSNVLGYANGFALEMIERHLRGDSIEAFVDHANLFLLSLNDSLTATIKAGYALHDQPAVLSLKTIWDYCIGWGVTDPRFYTGMYLDPAQTTGASKLLGHVFATNEAILAMLREWADRGSSLSFSFIDYMEDIPTLNRLFLENHPHGTPRGDGVLDRLSDAARTAEELAHAIFFMAVEDALPGARRRFSSQPWINTAAISLRPNDWEREGLFAPSTPRRDFSRVRGELERLYTRRDVGLQVRPLGCDRIRIASGVR